ncbi:MAG: Fic family protein [Actinobacteria bacterium]|nr:Fic family protein [Actinomycetota bacterium]
MKQPFIPPKLPPEIDYAALIKEVGEAHNALGKLNGLLVGIPNPDLLTTPLLTKEAVLSSKIEGTQATIEDVFKYEAEEKVSQATAKEADVREIINYRQAIREAIQELEKKPIGENLIKKVHFTLLDSVRGAHKDRGNLRRMQVYIGLPGAPMQEATFVPPPANEVPQLLSDWENYINSESKPDALVQIGLAHYQFEAIHPFMDGNGRIGRLLIPLFLYQRQLLDYPLLYISEYFEEHRRDYYDLLNRVSEVDDWHSWLRFFLTAVKTQSLKAQNTILAILDLHKQTRSEVAAVRSIYAYDLLDILFATPIVSSASIKGRLNTTPQTIHTLLSKFVEVGILEEALDRKRNKLYVFKRLIEIVE